MPRRGAAAFVQCVALGCATHHAPPVPAGPFLAIEQRTAPLPASSAPNAAAVSLAFGALPPETLGRVHRHLAEATTRAVRRALPALFLDDEPAPSSYADVLPDIPALTAAANLLGSPWNAEGISVALVPRCAPNASTCIPLFAPEEPADALGRRARALAWAFGHAALLRAPGDARARLLEELRRAALRSSGTIALVFDADHGTLDDAELGGLEADARRALAHWPADAPGQAWLGALAAAPGAWRLPFALGPDELFVVPRLSALARLRDFDAELARAGNSERLGSAAR
ncbi:MAG TPA: hypothetical protein VMI54_26310 [Polyangiaceae bacterium]|nr:hypothetical protein [Polyangiaceae bacterium]